MIRRSIFEWGQLVYGGDPDNQEMIPDWAAERLSIAAANSSFAKSNGTGVLEYGRKAIRARNIVGIIAAEGCSLEILPKIDGLLDDVNPKASVRRRLVDMLVWALNMDIDTGTVSEVDWQSDNLLEILIRLFCAKLADAVRRGMPRIYTAQEEDLPTVRGSLDVARQFTRHAVNPSKLACRFDELSHDIPLNQIMKAAVALLHSLARNHHNRTRLQELAFVYADISSLTPSLLRWDQVVLDRTNNRWAELLRLAKFLLSRQFQTTTSGTGHGYALLFDMNRLFEDYVGQLIGRSLLGGRYRAVLQGGRRFCLTEYDTGEALFQTRPDILIREGNEERFVIDTKWKQIAAKEIDRKHGISQADVYQMMAYERLYAPRGLCLLYPHHLGLQVGEGLISRYRIGTNGAMLSIISFDVSNGRDSLGRMRRLLSGFMSQEPVQYSS